MVLAAMSPRAPGVLKSVKLSKKGKKITIVIKKKKRAGIGA